MKSIVIKKAVSSDQRFLLTDGAGSDAIHTTTQYAYAVCLLKTDTELTGVGPAFTLGQGNNLVCQAIQQLAVKLEGKEINELMADFGAVYKSLVDDPDLRWLGPHKGVVHLALAAVVNACYDLWAKAKGVPLWKLLIDLSPEELVNTLDLSYLEDVLTREDAISILQNEQPHTRGRHTILDRGYKGYDTSVGWFNYADEKIAENIHKSIEKGFTAVKLKVGSQDSARDIRRAELVREIAGDRITIMLDANQQWNLPKAISVCNELAHINPYWIEEPTHPDDIFAHKTLADEIAPLKLALGEHVPNKVIFKNYLQAKCFSFNQADAVRVGGISEYIAISLLSKKFNIPMVPHVGDMGQIHQHLVFFNHISVGHEDLFLEYIPHLKNYFTHPAEIKDGYYVTPQEAGISAELKQY